MWDEWGYRSCVRKIKHEGVKLSMESFLDTIWNRNLYIGIPLGAFCYSLFLLFSFFNTMRNRTIRGLRLVLTACLVWTGSVSLMRLGIFPGVSFWHNFALLGLLSIPVFMYVFLFGFLEITEHDALIYIYSVLTLALVLGNARSGTILPAPELVNRAMAPAFMCIMQPSEPVFSLPWRLQ